MQRTFSISALLLILLFGSYAAAQTWHQGRTGYFTVTTDAGDGVARESLSRLEQERAIIGQLLHKNKVITPGSVQVIAVKDPASLKKAVAEFPADLLQRGAITFDGMERSSVIFV